MQLFRSEDEVDGWVEATGHDKGAVFSPGLVWDLASEWYDDRLRLDDSRERGPYRRRLGPRGRSLSFRAPSRSLLATRPWLSIR